MDFRNTILNNKTATAENNNKQRSQKMTHIYKHKMPLKGIRTVICTCLVAIVGLAATSSGTNAQDVFISEYIEGSSNNKAIEIFNGTNGEIDLSNYLMLRSNNGASAWVSDTLRMEGNLAKGEVFVIANPNADAAILAEADTTHSMTFYNGDDALGLFRISGSDTTLIDIFGALGVDPGSAWDVGSTVGGTNEQTLVRKSAIFQGNPDSLGSFGTDDLTSEWIVSARNDFSNLGSHTIDMWDITFQVNMNAAIDSAVFLPAEHEVFVAGDFNGFSTTQDTLKDGDGDGIYSKQITLQVGNYGFKYYTNTTRVNGWEADPNRSLAVSKDSVLTADSIRIATPNLTEAVFGNVQLFFQVNMEVQRVAGNFDPANNADHKVSVAGSMNDWSTTANVLTQSQDENIYETTIMLEDVQIPSDWKYKFVLNGSGWEGGADKDIGVTVNDLNNNVYVGINNTGTPPFFDGITLDDIFTSAGTVTFEVDMRPAYYFAEDSSGLPVDIQTMSSTGDDVDSVFTNGPLTNTTNGWETWGDANLGLRSDLRLYDDGSTEGDLVAGDSVFTITVDYAIGNAKTGEFKFSANGFDNENSFGGNHKLKVEAGGRYREVFGAMLQDDGTIDDTIYDEYILVTTEGATPVRNGGSGDDAVVTSNEDEGNDRPTGFVLEQNYPNPFNPSTNISFNLPQASDVTLTIYNILGQRVATLLNNKKFTSGNHLVPFNASNLASGIYIYRLEAGSFTSQKRMTLIK